MVNREIGSNLYAGVPLTSSLRTHAADMQIYKGYDLATRSNFITVQAIFEGRVKAARVDICISFDSSALEELRAVQEAINKLIKNHEDRTKTLKKKSKKRKLTSARR